MLGLKSSRNYIIVKNKKEFELAKNCDVCGYIILEDNNCIYIYEKQFGKWVKNRFILFGDVKDKDVTVTGHKAYQSFYSYCGKNNIEKMKQYYKPIAMWESFEQMHYCNIDYIQEKIYQPIYEYDANSSFTYGAMQLPNEFQLLKDYMMLLYDKKESSDNKITRSKFKNLQNFLIGYFARIKEFVKVRSEIIYNSNKNIETKMIEIVKNKGKVYLSNTDSIITDDIGNEVMQQYKGFKVGQFKLANKADKLYYKSPNAYQIGDKVVYSGLSYFARKHTDFFNDLYAEQKGSLINGFDFSINLEDESYMKLCRVQFNEIKVTVVNKIGELIDIFYYKAG